MNSGGSIMNTQQTDHSATAAHYERLARLAQVQGMVEEEVEARSVAASAEAGSAAMLLQRIDELLAEVTWLQRKYRAATPIFAVRINARLEAITVELRALNNATNGH